MLIRDKRLFGIFNLLDILIIIFIIGLILPALHYYVFYNNKGALEQKMLDRFIEQRKRRNVGFKTDARITMIEVIVSFKDLTLEDIKEIKLHDKETGPDGKTVAEIMWIGDKQPNYYLLSFNKEVLKTFSRNDLFSLPARLRLRGVVQENGAFEFKNMIVNTLGFFAFYSGRYKVDFVVEGLPPNQSVVGTITGQ